MGNKVGVVTVTYNSAPVIEGFIRSVLQQTHMNFVLYVIDNASRDATLRLIEDHKDRRIQIVANRDNLGVAEGNNQGICLALKEDCDFVLLINNDTEFPADLVSTMIAASERNNADLLVPKMMYFEPKDRIWCAGGHFNRWRGFISVHAGEGERDVGQYDVARTISYAPTCCMLIRASIFEKVGLMDNRYFVYSDDADFCWRAKKSGISFWYDPAAILYHKVSSLTGGKLSRFTIEYSTRNKVFFALKNLSFPFTIYSMVFFQISFLIKLVLRRDSKEIYLLKLEAYKNGINMFRSSRDHRPKFT